MAAYQPEDSTDCIGCEHRSKLAAEHVGHTKCSFHRKCASYTYWEPEFCTHCLIVEHALKQF